jgi:hypothetical protein
MKSQRVRLTAVAASLFVFAIGAAPYAAAQPVTSGTWFHHGLQLKLDVDGSATYMTCEGASCKNQSASWVSSGPSSVRITLDGGGAMTLTTNAANRGNLVTTDGTTVTMCGPGDNNTDGYCGA